MNNDVIFSTTEFQRRHYSIINHHSYSKFDTSMEEFIDFFDGLDSLISGRNLGRKVWFSARRTVLVQRRVG